MERNRVSIDELYRGILCRFKKEKAYVVSTFKSQLIEKWTRPVGRGRRISLDLGLNRGAIIVGEDKVVGLVLGRVGKNFFQTLEFGVLSNDDFGNLPCDRVGSLDKLIHQDSENWSVGVFNDSEEGIRPRCLANNSSFGGKGLTVVDNINSAYDIVVRTMGYVEEE